MQRIKHKRDSQKLDVNVIVRVENSSAVCDLLDGASNPEVGKAVRPYPGEARRIGPSSTRRVPYVKTVGAM